MRWTKWAVGIVLGGLLFVSPERTCAQSQVISDISPTSGPVGLPVDISGSGFGAAQGSSAVSLNGTNCTVLNWSDSDIVALVPASASSGVFTATVNGQGANSPSFTVTALPSGWSDGDVGSVGIAGSASYANGVFTAQGSGTGISGTGDEMNFVYQSLSSDGSIIARVVSITGGQAGVAIRETLNSGATTAEVDYNHNTYTYFHYRLTTGASTSSSARSASLPYWLEAVRSGSTFSVYTSPDGVNWTQLGSSQTITMAQDVYLGLVVSSNSNSSLATATFDNVSVSSTASPAPAISGLSPLAGYVGGQVTISGSGFGASEGSSLATLNGTALIINSWDDTSITATLPVGVTTGPIVVSLGPSMNDSNPVDFLVGTQPLPSWLDVDIGSVGSAGSASYSNGTFTVTGSGQGISGTSDQMNFLYQPLAGDGTIVARVVSVQGSGAQAGVMIRETLNTNATDAYDFYNSYMYFYYRTSTGGSTSNGGSLSISSLPYWIKLVRSGNTFTAYTSLNGYYWVQLDSTETISMAQSVYVGLAVSSRNNSSMATATFDNVSISSAASPAPVISTLSATTGPVGTEVLISGSGFGTDQGSSVATLNNAALTVDSWSDSAIVVTIPSGATSGSVVVSVAPSMNDSNAVMFQVTANALPPPWLDADIGSAQIAGSAAYSNGIFTVTASGAGISGASDAMHFVYQPLSGDGSIVARVVGNTRGQAGVMIRETLNANATDAYGFLYSEYNYFEFYDRPTTGASTSNGGSGSVVTLPYWIMVVRSGNTFTAYTSVSGWSWTQLGTTQTITMAQNVYIGLGVSSQSNSSATTATFDNVSVNSTAAPAPVITSLSGTTGSVGSQIEIFGSGFGSSGVGSLVMLNGVPATIDSWSATSIIVTIPSGATSGPMAVSVAPSMNDSNAVMFEVTSQPLPIPWLDQDIGNVGATGSASYASGTFTVKGAGMISGTSDTFHFVYQPLSGSGSIVARVVSVTSSSEQAGVMIRETLNPSATDAFAFISSAYNYFTFYDRPSTGASTSNGGTGNVVTLPYWVQLVRNGNSVSSYVSPDGANWTQVGTTQTITMAQTVYVGLAVSSMSSGGSTLQTATFDNVSVTVGTTPFVTGLSPALAGIGSSITITGSNFGATQGNSTVSFDGVAATSITSWSDDQIVALVPAGAATGPVSVTVNSIQSVANPTLTIINPVISSVSPPAAALGGQVTITGTGFGNYIGAGQVEINGVSQDALVWSDTSITFSVMPNTTSGPLSVIVEGISSNSVAFTVQSAPSITTLSPTSGLVGSSITIAGTGFGSTQSDSTVAVDGIVAAVSSWSDTQVIATVPTGASTGPVNVTVGGITADGPSFEVTTSVQLSDSLGNQTTYYSLIAGGKWYVSTSQGSGCSSCTLRGNISDQYDTFGSLLSATDELGHTTSYTYDSNQNVTSITQPSVSGGAPTTTYTYNSYGEVLTMTDPLGHVTTNGYSPIGNLTSVTTPAPDGNTPASATQFAYNYQGEMTQITDPLGHVTTITYTPQGYISTITDPQSNVTTYGYDSRGNRTSVTDAMNHQTTFTYDAGNRLTQIAYPDQSTASFGYDYRGRRTSMTDQNGKTTAYTYDDADRLTSVTDAAGNATQYGYDTESNLTSITDANGRTTNFAYDTYGRVTQTTFPSNYFETYSYDADNNLTSKTDRNGNTIQYVYDALNRLTQKNYPDSTSAEYTYDLVGKISQVNDPTGTYAFAYDNMGRLIGTTTTYSFLPNTPSTNSYTYDADSNRTGYTAPDGGTNTYSYDTLNRLTTLANSWAGSFGFSYDSLSRRTQMTRPNGITTNYTYDSLSRLLSVLHQAGGGTIDGDVYTLDAAGNRTAKTDDLTGVNSSYTYDLIYELTQVQQSNTTTESYSYDPVGNRLSSLGVPSYTVNSSNELTGNSSASYTYDQNGNTTSKTDSTGTTSYAWDYENRLTSVTLPGQGGTVQFKYDPFGRRIEKISPTTTSIFAYGGPNLVETVNSTGAMVARYTQTQNVDEPLAESTSGGSDYYEADGLGSITSLTSSSGTIAQTYTYDSLGNTTHSTGSLANPFQYTAREFDSETGLYYYRARYYDPTVGRFASEDPIGFSGGHNFYRYARNNPIRRKDPSGLCPIFVGYRPEITLLPTVGPPMQLVHTFLVLGCGNDRNVFEAQPNGPLWPWSNPKIDAETYPLIPGLDPSNPVWTDPEVYVQDDGMPCSTDLQTLTNFAQLVNKANVPYHLLGPNSNTVTSGGLSALGVNDWSPPVIAPGW